MDLSHVNVDDVYIALGSMGRYQILKYVLTTITWFSEAFHGLNIVFIGIANPQVCAPPSDNVSSLTNNTEVIYDECSIRYINNVTGRDNATSCIYGYQYEHPRDMSVVSEFNLVCDQAALADFSQTLLYVGMAIGSSTLPMVSDRYGRKPVCIISNMLCLLLGIATSFSPSYIFFVSMKLITGIFLQGNTLSAVTLTVELFPPDKRRFVGTCGIIIWSIMVGLLAPIAYLFRTYSWRIVNLAIISVSSYSFIQYWLMDESIRWLIANNKVKETVRLIKKAAKMNKVDPLKPLQLIYQQEMLPIDNSKPDDKLLPHVIVNDKPRKADKMRYTLMDIFKSRKLALSLIIIWFTWFTNSLVYFGIFLTSSSLAGNMYLNFFLNGIIETPAAIIYWHTIDRIGRKKTAIMFHLFAAIGLIGATVLRLSDAEWATTTATVLSLFGKMGISGSFNTIYFYTPEIFPTNIRNITFGTASTAARIGGMLAPFSSLLAASIPWAPGAIFGACCLIVTVLIIFLPETSGKELPQTMDDLDKLYRHQEK